MSHIKTVKVTCAVANTAYCVQTGTTSGPTGARDLAFVGQEVQFQNQTLASTATVGGSDIVSNAGLILIGQGTTSDPIRGNTPTSIQLAEWWVSSSVAGGIVVAFLRKLV